MKSLKLILNKTFIISIILTKKSRRKKKVEIGQLLRKFDQTFFGLLFTIEIMLKILKITIFLNDCFIIVSII